MTPGALVLAIDTATSQAGVALYDGGVVAELTWRAGRDHGRQLAPRIRDMLATAGTSIEAIGAIGVNRGPGSFTGVRVGLSMAIGISIARELPVYAFDSLHITAAAHIPTSGTVLVVVEAGRERYVAGLATPGDPPTAMENVGIDGILDLWRANRVGPPTIVGELNAATRARLAAHGDDIRFATPAQSVRRPAVLAELAWRAWQRGVVPDGAHVDAIYLSRT